MEIKSTHSEADAENLFYELIIALATLSRWSLFARREFGDAENRARALALVPAVALVAGIIFAAVDRSIGDFLRPISRSFVVLTFIELAAGGMDVLGIADLVDAIRIGSRPASTGLARIGPVGAIASMAWFLVAIYLLSLIHDSAGRSGAVVMASMLSRWAIVPIGYGLRPLERWGLGVPYEDGIRFREFAV